MTHSSNCKQYYYGAKYSLSENELINPAESNVAKVKAVCDSPNCTMMQFDVF